MKIALLGYGTVGGGVYQLLADREDITVKYVLDRIPHPELGQQSITDFSVILADDEVDTVVELIGGTEPAGSYIAAALQAGKNVVSANKHLLAEQYNVLPALAKEKGVSLRATAAVGGGIPWLVNLQRTKRLGQVTEVGGIMNGTTNFILDAMHRKGYDFASVLADAQKLGYAEADPSADIDGLDIQRKLILSANIAFDVSLTEQQVPVFGIRHITKADVDSFKEAGLVCKLYASARINAEGAVAAVVEPTLFAADALEASVPSNFNIVTAVSQFAGRQSFFGQGAGRWPTAYAVVQDLIDLAERPMPFYSQSSQPAVMDELSGQRRYYVRYTVDTWFMDGVVEKRMGCGVVTRPVCPAEMHAWAKEACKCDPHIFFAALNG